jgi:hypothetical protein
MLVQNVKLKLLWQIHEFGIGKYFLGHNIKDDG